MKSFLGRAVEAWDVLNGKPLPGTTTYNLKCYKADDLYLSSVAFKHHRNLLAVSFAVFVIVFGDFGTFNSILGFNPKNGISSKSILWLLLPILIYELVMFWNSSNESKNRFGNLDGIGLTLEKPVVITHFQKDNIPQILQDSDKTLEIFITKWEPRLSSLARSTDIDNTLIRIRNNVQECLDMIPDPNNFTKSNSDGEIGIDQRYQNVLDAMRHGVIGLKTDIEKKLNFIESLTLTEFRDDFLKRIIAIEDYHRVQNSNIDKLINDLKRVSPKVKLSNFLYIVLPLLIGIFALFLILCNLNWSNLFN